MTNFAHYACGFWRDGQMPAITPVFIVSYDQKNHAYQVARDEYDAFVQWVAQTWARDDEVRGDEESNTDYLERLGVTIRELNWS